MENSESLLVSVSPLNISALSEQLPENVSHEPGDVALMLLGDMLNNHDSPLDTARRRYQEICNASVEPNYVPAHEVIQKHVISPLKEAKQCYSLGMPIACIALAGLVGEMVAIWQFEMLNPQEQHLQQSLMGRRYEKLGQEDRVRVLQAFQSIDADTVNAFTKLRELRRKYLHFRADTGEKADKDARESLNNAYLLVTKTLGISLQDGSLLFPPKVWTYIKDIVKNNKTAAT